MLSVRLQFVTVYNTVCHNFLAYSEYACNVLQPSPIQVLLAYKKNRRRNSHEWVPVKAPNCIYVYKKMNREAKDAIQLFTFGLVPASKYPDSACTYS